MLDILFGMNTWVSRIFLSKGFISWIAVQYSTLPSHRRRTTDVDKKYYAH